MLFVFTTPNFAQIIFENLFTNFSFRATIPTASFAKPVRGIPECFCVNRYHSDFVWFRWVLEALLVDLSYPKVCLRWAPINRDTLYGWKAYHYALIFNCLNPFDLLVKERFLFDWERKYSSAFWNSNTPVNFFFKKSLFLLSKQPENNFNRWFLWHLFRQLRALFNARMGWIVSAFAKVFCHKGTKGTKNSALRVEGFTHTKAEVVKSYSERPLTFRKHPIAFWPWWFRMTLMMILRVRGIRAFP